ncbi:MAG: hypothetical protein KDD46_03500 [Bdellovibrionales bacterium]|nr:hypothetical protein [Bdellovibrionales bacterium]
MKKIILLQILALSLLQCSSSNSEFSSSIYPAGLSITSPTVGQASNSNNNQLIQLGNFDSTQSFTAKRDALESLASGDSTCTFVFPSFVAPFPTPECYGPKLYYKNHPDGADEAVEMGETFPYVPSGDVGIWEENENDQACAAAKMNQEIGNVGQKVDASLLFIAGISCLIETDGDLELPEAGDDLDLTETLASAIEENNPNITIDSATLERLSDASDGFAVYQYNIEATDTSGREFMIYLTHHPVNDDGSNYQGKLWSSYETGNPTEFGTANSYAFSLSYERNEQNLLYRMLSTTYSRATVTGSDMFDTSFDVDPTGCAGANCWENFAQTIGNIDTDTGLGALSYGWQAGTDDADGSTKLARIFNVYTEEVEDETRGYAFFGFGRGFNKTTGDIGTNSINRFICNWAGPGNSHTGTEDRAQKQTMLFNESTGKFESDATNLEYAPKNSCNYDGSGTFGFTTDSSVNLNDVGNQSGMITNNLINLDTDEDFANYTAPTLPSENF